MFVLNILDMLLVSSLEKSLRLLVIPETTSKLFELTLKEMYMYIVVGS